MYEIEQSLIKLFVYLGTFSYVHDEVIIRSHFVLKIFSTNLDLFCQILLHCFAPFFTGHKKYRVWSPRCWWPSTCRRQRRQRHARPSDTPLGSFYGFCAFEMSEWWGVGRGKEREGGMGFGPPYAISHVRLVEVSRVK